MAKKNEVKENKFTKTQIVESKRYIEDRDILKAILDDKEYTLKEIDDIIIKFKKERVK